MWFIPLYKYILYQSNYKKAYIGDLSINLARLEQSLALIIKNIYRQSAILLLDKADVFLTERTLSNI